MTWKKQSLAHPPSTAAPLNPIDITLLLFSSLLSAHLRMCVHEFAIPRQLSQSATHHPPSIACVKGGEPSSTAYPPNPVTKQNYYLCGVGVKLRL